MYNYKKINEFVKVLSEYDKFILCDANKRPISVWTQYFADPTNPCTWGSFDKALNLYKANPDKYAAIGYCLNDDGVVCIDIDHCIGENGELNETAKEIISHIDNPTYIEVSMSGTGLHIFVKGHKNTDKCRKDDVEVYSTKRYIAITAIPYKDMFQDVTENQALIDYVCDTYLTAETIPTTTSSSTTECITVLDDDELLSKAYHAKNGEKFRALWDGNDEGYTSPSEADLALMNILAFWTAKNAEQMKRLFCSSDRMRNKIYREDYLDRTIAKAISNCNGIYTPSHLENESDDWSGSPFTSAEIESTIETLNPLTNPKFSNFDDIELSLLYGFIIKDKICYVTESGKWAIYDGTKFVMDSKNATLTHKAIKHISSTLQKYFKKHLKPIDPITPDKAIEEHNKRLCKLSTKVASNTFRTKLESDLRERNPISLQQFDQDKNKFNCINGTLDLKTMTLQPHNPNDLLSKVNGVAYDPNASCPLFAEKVSEIMDHNEEKVHFLQMALGSALLGYNSLEKMYIMYGPTTRNGKSTITECIHSIFGDYGCNMEPESLAQAKKDSRAASGDIARLRATRYVQAAEPNKNMIFDVALVKRLTGNDTLTARNLFESEFEFKPNFVIFLNTNYLPKVMDTTLFASDRIRVIPFEHHFSEEERDPFLKEKLKDEYSGILNWLITGMQEFKKNPTYFPDVIRKATLDYLADSDKTEQFISDTFESSENSKILGKEVYSLYREWCEENGFKAEGKPGFFNELRKKNYIKETSTVNGITERNVLVGFRQIESDFGKGNPHDTPY